MEPSRKMGQVRSSCESNREGTEWDSWARGKNGRISGQCDKVYIRIGRYS